MTTAGKTPPLQQPRQRTRRILVIASLIGALPAQLAFFALMLLSRTESGLSVLAGALVVCVPQLWFVLRATRSGLPTAAAGLALAKFGLVSTGFALWFVWRPEAELLATLSGSAVTLVATTGAIAFVQRQL